MATIKIKDLPKDMKIGRDELKRIRGGAISLASIRYGKSRYDKWFYGEYKWRPMDVTYYKM